MLVIVGRTWKFHIFNPCPFHFYSPGFRASLAGLQIYQ
jgi:hypothetical protein